MADLFDDVPMPDDADAPPNVVDIERARRQRPRGDALPTVRISARLHELVDSVSALLKGDANVYQRDGRLVRIVRVVDADAPRARMAIGSPQIRPLQTATLRERLTLLAEFEKFDARDKKWVRCLPPPPLLAALEERGEWPSVRPVVGITETPSMRPDGSVIDAPGYDASTGYVYMPATDYPMVPARPTLDDAHAALAALLEPWADFPFAAAPDRYVAVAALLTLTARPAIAGACPAFVVDAPTRGSGKSLLSRAITTLAHGREAALVTWPSTPEELEKILGAYALRGAAVINWDNVTGEFGGAPLDKVLTCADRVELRILGRTEVPTLAWRAVTLANGNNMMIGGDTARRVLVARLEPMMERPEERTGYVIDDLIGWCRAHHARLVGAGLTMLRAYVIAGRPPQHLAGWGSFEDWRDLIGSAIVWAGGDDIMACRPTIAGHDDAELGALRTVMEDLPRLAPMGISCAAIVSSLYPPERMRGNAPPDGFDGLREALEVLAPPKQGSPPTAQRLGYAFRRARKRVVGGRYLAKVETSDHANVTRWRVAAAADQASAGHASDAGDIPDPSRATSHDVF